MVPGRRQARAARIRPEESGGWLAILDHGCHITSIAMYLMGPVEQVHTMIGVSKDLPDASSGPPAMITFKFASGEALPELRLHYRTLGKPVQGVTTRSMEQIQAYSWPGNVRELQNVLERAAILAEGPIVSLEEALTGRGDIGTGPFGIIGNIIWLLVAGWWLALGHLISAALDFITIIGIPFGVQHIKLAGASLFPIGLTIVERGRRRNT